MLTEEKVSKAVSEGGSVRQAAKLLGKSQTSLQWWMMKHGFRVEKRATLVKARCDQEK